MFEKDICGVIEQVYAQMGKVKRNIVVACYNNDFSLDTIDAQRVCGRKLLRFYEGMWSVLPAQGYAFRILQYRRMQAERRRASG